MFWNSVDVCWSIFVRQLDLVSYANKNGTNKDTPINVNTVSEHTLRTLLLRFHDCNDNYDNNGEFQDTIWSVCSTARKRIGHRTRKMSKSSTSTIRAFSKRKSNSFAANSFWPMFNNDIFACLKFLRHVTLGEGHIDEPTRIQLLGALDSEATGTLKKNLLETMNKGAEDATKKSMQSFCL